jgi:hypothetical protein
VEQWEEEEEEEEEWLVGRVTFSI